MRILLLCITVIYLFIDFIPVKRKKFCKPLDNIIINEGFGYLRKDGIRHYGIDLHAPYKTKVYAMSSGDIEYGYNERKGYYAIITDPPYKFLYAHLSPNKYTNKTIECGEVVGESGSSGYSFGPHLHIETLTSEVHVNPLLLEYYK